MSDIYDLVPEMDQYFPGHGWAVNLNRVRILWLPVLRLYQHSGSHHKYFTDNRIGGVWLQSRSPERTLRHLAVCFRDLHKEIREILPLSDVFHNAEKNKNDLTRLFQGEQRIEILLIAAFTLLRRLADELIDTSRPFLFEHWHSAPRKMSVAVSFARNSKLQKYKPICDLDVLTDALLNKTSWLDKLRDKNGIRDIIVHKPHILQIGPRGSSKHGEEIRWEISAHLIRNVGVEHNIEAIDLFRNLLECIDESCKFMEKLCISAGLVDNNKKDGFWRGGFMLLTGQDNDIVGFWPPLGSPREEFPLMD